MSKIYGLAILFSLLLTRPGWAQQPAYDEDDEEALAQQEAAQQAQAGPQAQQYGFVGAHPIPYDQGSGFCYEQGAHFHEYPPFDQYLFRESGGWFYFTGDPGDFGYTQQTWGYNGNHPIPAEYGGSYCFITWPHRHFYSPTASMAFNLVGGYYSYTGPWDPWYWTWRDRYVGYWGGYYRNSYYGGRYYTVRPPAVYRPAFRAGAPGVYRPGVVVNAPPGHYGGGVRVGAPPARITVPAPRAGYVAPPGGRPGAPGPAQHYAPAPAPHYAPAPGPHYTTPAPAPHYAPAPAPHYTTPAPAPHYAPAPAPHYTTPAPAPHYAPAPAPHYTAPPPARRSAPPPAPAARHR